jgi:tetratricopeptide (TPR) repeat protein
MHIGGITAFFLAAASLLVAAPGPARAADGTKPDCQVGKICTTLDAAQVFELADRLGQVGRMRDAAVTLQGLTSDPDPQIRAEARFRLASIEERAGNLAAAAGAYRALLAEMPNATRVRLEFARVLVQMGEENAASSQLRRAASAGLPEDVARVVDTFQLAIRSRRRTGLSIEFGLAPDSNINNATTDTTIMIGNTPLALDRDARARSGLGATLSSQAFWRPAITADTNILLSASINADLYRQSAFNNIGLSLSAGPELLRHRTRYRPSILANWRWFGGKPFSSSYGLSLNVMRQIDRVSQVQFDLSAIDTRYQINPAMDAATFSLSARYERALSPRLYGRITNRVDRQNARQAPFSTWSASTVWLMTRDLGRHSIYGSAGLTRTWGDAAFTLPPARRDDKLVELELGVLLRGFAYKGFAPLIQLRRTINQSPVFLYDFRRTRIEFGLTREF